MKKYTVQEGDTPDGLASMFRFKDWKNIYDHKDNEALRGKRGPNEIVPGDVVSIPDAFTELPSGSSATLNASDKLPLAPVIFDAHMHIMSGNCTPFPVAYYTQLEPRPVVGGLLSPRSSRKLLNKVGSTSIVSFFLPFLGWSPRTTLVIGQDTVQQNDSVPAVFRKAESTPELRDCRPSFLGISIVLTMDMDLCQLDGYKGQAVYTKKKLPDAKEPVYTYSVRLTGDVNERPDEGVAHPGEWGLFENWTHQILRTKVAAAEHPFRLVPMYHYEPRRFSVWTGQEKSFQEASLAANWDRPFSELATDKQAGMFAGFKMYTSQAYQPVDPNVPSLAKFFARCAGEGIPIMTHCTPAGHFTHDRKLYIDLDPAAAGQLSQADQDAYQDAREKREKYLDAKERFTKAEKTFEDYCKQHHLPLDPYVYQAYGTLAPELTTALPTDPEYWKAYSEYQEATTDIDETGEHYERAARIVRKHEDIQSRFERAGGDLQKMEQDPPLRLKYFKEKHLHPEAWRPLLEKHPKLRLCLAHFASDACLWWHYLKDENGKCRDLDDVPYDKNWVTSIVELCTKYENFYTDISYLPLMEPLQPTPGRTKEERKANKKQTAKLHWHGLAKACEQPGMLTKILFGTDWYMILASKYGYAKWHREALEGLALVEKHLESKGLMPRKINLFYQFAVVNPMRFYRMPLIADKLKEGIEAFRDTPLLSEEEKETYFAETPHRMARNHPLVKNLAAVLEKVENAPGKDKGLLYEDMVRFVNLVPTS